MTDDEARQSLNMRLARQGAATDCPLCHTNRWRVEVTHPSTTESPRSILAFVAEGDILRTCRACGYRQHFAAVPME